MTATCREPCCSVTPDVTVTELFERGFRRNRAPHCAIAGPPCIAADANSAAFSLEVANGRIVQVGLRASCCATLLAYCEYIATVTPGLRCNLAWSLAASDLIAAVRGVPAMKRERAVLAIAAFRAALLAAGRSHATQGDGP
jgi:hypothetical protein